MADRWDSALYEDRHSFVWQAGADLVTALDATPGERILDLGCGTGQLTAKIAESGAEVTGLDSSVSMIALARQNYPKLKFVLGDARGFRFDRPFHAVFSNAALHWIPEAEAVIRNVAAALVPRGRFVLEMGAKGNVDRIRKAIEGVIPGVACPWYFPSTAEYTALLEAHGFEIQWAQSFERWTQLEHPERGLREWLEMFAGAYFERMTPQHREEAMREIETRLRPQIFCDGAWWADYRRLRVSAQLS